MIFELARDYSDALEAIRLCSFHGAQGCGGQVPKHDSEWRTLELLDEAIRRDLHFVVARSVELNLTSRFCRNSFFLCGNTWGKRSGLCLRIAAT